MNDLAIWLNSAGEAFVSFAGSMLLQSSVLIVVLAVLDLILRKRVKAVVRYWVWLLVLVKLILPPSLSSPTGLGYWVGDKLPSLPARIEPVEPHGYGQEMVGTAHPTKASPAWEPEAPYADSFDAFPITRSSESFSYREDSITATAAAAPAPKITWQAGVLLAWAAVVVAMVLLLIQRAFFVRSLVSQSTEAPEGMVGLLNRCRDRMRVKTAVSLRLSSVSMSPSVCGLWRPRILLPQSMLDQLDATQWQSILLHELAHIKRGDLWVNLAQALLQIVYFFHPLLWLANAAIRRVREQAVDEAVLASMGERAEEYPRTLLSVSKLAFGRPALSLRLLGVVESKKALTARIKHIVSRPFPKTAKLGFAGLILILATAAFLLPMAKAEPQEKNMTPAKPQAVDAPGKTATADSNSPDVSSTRVTRTIEGIVTDPLGRPRQCVYIAPQGQRIWDGVRSDVQGRFKLENVQPEQHIWIAYSQASKLYGIFALPEPLPPGPVRVILNLGEADLEGRVVGPDGKALARRKVELIVTTPDGIRFPLDYQPETNTYGYYSHGKVPCSEGLVVEARLVAEDQERSSAKMRADRSFIEMPVLVAAREKIQPDYDRNMKNDGMLQCGGRVVDEAGKPISNVRVHLAFDMSGHMSTWVREAVTDEQGRWHRPMPPECMGLSLGFEHAEYYVDDREIRPPREELTNEKHLVTMKRGFLLAGKVIDGQGEPVENALVCGDRPSSFTPSPYNQIIENSRMARTVVDGTFRIRGLSPGVRNITVYSDHHAPTIQEVDIHQDMDPVCATLSQGKTCRGRVVDARGNPIEGVRVGTQRWQSGKEQCWMSRIGVTNAEGTFTLHNLPEGQISINFSKKGFLGFGKGLPQDVSQVDQTVMYATPVFMGKVVDADTGEPIRDFVVVNGIRSSTGSSLDWSRYWRASVEDGDGAFTHQWGGWHLTYPLSYGPCIRIEAKGYLSSVSPPVEFGQTCGPLVIRLKRGDPIVGTVLQADGAPAPMAQVALVRKGEKAYVDRDQFSADNFAYQTELTTATDPNGRFELPPIEEQGLIVTVHRSGYAQVQSADFVGGSELRLTAWSRVEGTIDRSAISESEIEIALYALDRNTDRQVPSIDWLIGRITPTGDTFAFDCVPSVPVAVGRISRFEMHDGRYFVPEPGKTHTVHIGARGRVVTGRIVPPSGDSGAFADPRRVHAVAFRSGENATGIPAIDESSFEWLWRDKENVYKPSTTLRKRFIPTIAEDGSFTFAGLEPGVYEFVINAHAPLGENVSCGRGVLEAVAVSQFTVPEGEATSAIRVPDISLQLLGYPKVGDMAPLFEATTFDGETIRLADLRGKVVLLDFWATWCKPCVAQLPHLQESHQAYATDARFVMIGLSLDWDIEKARDFLAEKQLKWPQVRLGDMDTSPIVKQYGVGGIPTTVLIDPEGRIIAMGEGIDGLAEKIRDALAQ